MTERKAPEAPIELIRKVIDRNRSVAVIIETFRIEDGIKVPFYVIKKFIQADFSSLSSEGRWVNVSDSYTFPDLLKRFELLFGKVDVSHVQNQKWFRRNKKCNVLGVPATPPKGKLSEALQGVARIHKEAGATRANAGREVRIHFPEHLFPNVSDVHIQSAINAVYGPAPLKHPATSRVNTWVM